MSRIVAITVACLVVIVLRTAPVHAEAPAVPVWMRVRSLGSEAAQPNEAVSAEARPLGAHRSAKRGAYMTAAGTGLVVAGVLHAGLLGHKGVCYESDERLGLPIATGVTVATAGLIMTIVGVRKMRTVAREQRQLLGRHKNSALMISLTTAAVASGLLFALAAPLWAACISS